MRYVLAGVALALLATSAACSPGQLDRALGPMPALPAAQAAGHEAPAADIAVPGRLLVVKDGNLYQWSQGSFKPLTSGTRYQCPAISPDGTHIAASVVGENHSDLVLLDAQGRRLRQLTDNWSKARVEDSAWARHPTWSPDGRSIAYTTDVYGDAMSLWMVDAAGGNRRQVMASPGMAGLDSPAWSPKARELALTVFEGQNSQVYLFVVASAAVAKLTAHEEGAYDPAWSPNGERIAYVARAEGRTDVWVMDEDGANQVRITDVGTARSPVWSPSDDMLAFLADQGRGFDLYVARIDRTNPATVPAAEVKQLTSGENLEAPSGTSWAE